MGLSGILLCDLILTIINKINCAHEFSLYIYLWCINRKDHVKKEKAKSSFFWGGTIPHWWV